MRCGLTLHLLWVLYSRRRACSIVGRLLTAVLQAFWLVRVEAELRQRTAAGVCIQSACCGIATRFRRPAGRQGRWDSLLVPHTMRRFEIDAIFKD